MHPRLVAILGALLAEKGRVGELCRVSGLKSESFLAAAGRKGTRRKWKDICCFQRLQLALWICGAGQKNVVDRCVKIEYLYQDERGRAVIRMFESHSRPRQRTYTRSRHWTNIVVAMIERGCLWPSLRCDTFEAFNFSNPVLWGECLRAADLYFSLSHQQVGGELHDESEGDSEWVKELEGRLECKEINAAVIPASQLIGWVKDFPSAWYFLEAGQLFENPILAKERWNKARSINPDTAIVKTPRNGACPYCQGNIGDNWHTHLMACANYRHQVKERLARQSQGFAKVFPKASLQEPDQRAPKRRRSSPSEQPASPKKTQTSKAGGPRNNHKNLKRRR